MRTLSFLLLSFLLVSCSAETDDGDLSSATLRLGWIPSGSFAGEVAGQALFANENGLALQIRPGGPGINTVSLVASGQDTFGTLSADEVLLANESGADLVIIGVINDVSPGAFVSLAGSGITSPMDFSGRTVGVLPFGSTTLLYEAMLERNGVDRTTVRERTISPDLRPFIEGVYDVHPVFVYDETVTLERQGVDYNLIEPREFGVHFKGPVYFTSRDVVEHRPELVGAFVRTMAEGWNYALAQPEEAIALLKAFESDIDADRELAVLLKGADYFQAFQGQPLNSDPASWVEMVDLMVTFGRLAQRPNLEQVLRLEWVQEAYRDRE